MGRLKPNGQPILAASSEAFTMYDGSAVPVDCYMILAHNHDLIYHTKMCVPVCAVGTETQFLGTTDLDWFQTDGSTPPDEGTLCGTCMELSWSFGWSGMNPGVTEHQE